MRNGFYTSRKKSIRLLWGLIDLSWIDLWGGEGIWTGMVTVASLVGAVVTVHDGHGRHVEVGLRVLWVCMSLDFALYHNLP
jgi:hypothetical protein